MLTPQAVENVRTYHLLTVCSIGEILQAIILHKVFQYKAAHTLLVDTFEFKLFNVFTKYFRYIIDNLI